MNPAEWKQMAEEKLLAADSLRMILPTSAYHLAGLAVELGLKACFLTRLTNTPEVVFDKDAKNCWIHDLKLLLGIAGLKPDLDAAKATASPLAQNWEVVREWSIESRYESKTPGEAQAMYHAIADPKTGVMQWIRAHW